MRSGYACRQCGYRCAKWLGRCPDCDAWGTVQQTPAGEPPPATGAHAPALVRPYPEIASGDTARSSTGIGELDRVLGGGLVPGGVVLVGGEPGIGKSTLLLQAASKIAESGCPVLYASGEESAAQLRTRGDRLGVHSDKLLVAAETDVDALLAAAEHHRPALIIVDSIQAVRSEGSASLPGSVAQVRESAARFVAHAKTRGTPVLLVGHVTKDGTLAGPRALEHVVDTVLQFEGDRHHEHRLLRALKNRFGPTDELGIFRMTESGLEEVLGPSELFLAERVENVPGSVVLAAIEGTRPLLVEVQALVGAPGHGSPRRTALGVDGNRVAMILAVIQRRTGIELGDRDVFVNVTGGLTVVEPASDLAVAAAVLSSARQCPLPPDVALFGEIGLTGEVRAVSRIETRLREAARLGFTTAVGPAPPRRDTPTPGLELIAVRHLDQAIPRMFGRAATDQIG